MNCVIVQPPFVQLNTAYPAAWYLESFLRSRGHKAEAFDHSIETFHSIFCRAGLERVFADAAIAWDSMSTTADEATRSQVERYFSSDPSGIALVCRKSGRVRGFVAGTAEPRGFYGRLLVRRWPRFALASVGPVLRNPIIVPRLLNAFRKRKEEPDEQGCGLLMSVAVDPLDRSATEAPTALPARAPATQRPW